MIKYLLVGLLLANSVWAAPLDRIVAVVNNEIVLDSELVEMEQTVRQQLRQRNAAIPSSDILRRQVLERLIMQKLQLQRAEMSGIRVADDALNAADGHPELAAPQMETDHLNLFRQLLLECKRLLSRALECLRLIVLLGKLRRRYRGGRLRWQFFAVGLLEQALPKWVVP